MYRLGLLFVMMAAIAGDLFGGGTDTFDAQLMAKYSGSDRVVAETIAKAAEQKTLSEFQNVLNRIPEKKSDEILIALLNHPSDSVVIKVTDILAGRRKRSIAEALYLRFQESRNLVIGGSEARFRKEEANQHVERALQAVVGRVISSDIPLDERIKQYSEAIAALK
jgi:hypothetical protein